MVPHDVTMQGLSLRSSPNHPASFLHDYVVDTTKTMASIPADRPTLAANPGSPMEELAQVLRRKMEHLDPSLDHDTDWAALPERKKEFFRLCIKAVFFDRALARAALE